MKWKKTVCGRSTKHMRNRSLHIFIPFVTIMLWRRICRISVGGICPHIVFIHTSDIFVWYDIYKMGLQGGRRWRN